MLAPSPHLPLIFGIVYGGGGSTCEKEDGDDRYASQCAHDETEDCPTPFFNDER